MTNALVFVLNATWQAAVLFALGHVIARRLRRSPAQFEYVVWSAVLLVASVTPWLSLAMSRSPMRLVHQWGWQSDAVTGLGLWLDGGAPSLGSRVAAPQHWNVLLLLLWVYLFFITAQLGRFAWGSLQVRRFVREGTECNDRRVLRIGERVLRGKPGRAIQILVSNAAPVPFAIGLLRPQIILPSALLTDATDDELAAVLAHEFAHVQRNDWIFNLLALLLSIPISFHPCAALMRKKVEASREAACDEFAAGCMASPTAYARALLDLASRLAQPHPSLAAAYKGAAMGVLDVSTLGDRIRRLMDRSPRLNPKRTRLTFFACMGVLIVASVVITSFALASPSATDGDGAVAGIWAGQFTDQHPGAGLPKAVHTPVCLQLQQSASEIGGSWGCNNVGPAFPIQAAELNDNRLHFTATPPSQGDVTVTWSFDLLVTGNQMSGVGHAVRNDKHSWDVEVNLTRKAQN